MRSSMKTFAVLALSVAVLVGGSQPRRAFAIDGVIQNPANGHWYKIVTILPANASTVVTWGTAKSAAEGLGGYLASITSSAENQWIQQYLTFGLGIGAGYWIGGTDSASEGSWTWVNGDSWSYSNWYGSGQWPKNNDGSEDYLTMSPSGGWTNWASSFGNPGYVIEWDYDPNGPPPPLPVPIAPSSLLASVLPDNPISLSWADNSDNEADFEVERRTDATAFQRIGTTGPNATLYEDYATDPGTLYTYRVRAVNSGGSSDYSNEASTTASAIAPAPKAPSDLAVVVATRDSVELSWIDESTNEIGFQVKRRTPGGDYENVAMTGEGAVSFLEAGLPPDTEYVYGVRAVSAARVSAYAEVVASTLPTLEVTTLTGDLKDTEKFGKDSVTVTATYGFLAGVSDGAAEFVAEGLTVRAGPEAGPFALRILPDDEGWKVRGAKATWKSPKGSTRKFTVQVDSEKRILRFSGKGLELVVPPANPMRVSLAVGDDAGTSRIDWEETKPGSFRLR